MDLEELMLRLQSGKKDVFEEIYHATKRAVFVTVFSLLRHKEATEDVMQDTYLRLTEKIQKYKPNGTPKAWICKIARNLAVNSLKKNKRCVPLEALRDQGATEEEPIDILTLAVKVLNPKEFECVYLKTAGGFKHKEIAEMTGSLHETIRWRYNHAIEKLKNFFEEEKNV